MIYFKLCNNIEKLRNTQAVSEQFQVSLSIPTGFASMIFQNVCGTSIVERYAIQLDLFVCSVKISSPFHKPGS